MKRFTLIDKAFLLKKAPPFSALDLNLLLAIADQLGTAHYATGDIIFSKQEEASRMYFIGQGEVMIDNGTSRLLSPGDYFGDESLFCDQTRIYAATSKTPSQLFTLSRSHLHAIIGDSPSVALGFLREYTLRFNQRSEP